MINVRLALKRLKKIDAELSPYFGDIEKRLRLYNERLSSFGGGGLLDFANGHLYFGFQKTERGWAFREWLPGADGVWLTGDFNGWDRFATPLKYIGNGVWEVTLDGTDALCHGQYIKLIVRRGNEVFERIPAYIRKCDMDTRNMRLCGQIWQPDEPFRFTDGEWLKKRHRRTPLIYEAHIGMAQERAGVGSYREFADVTLEWIKRAGYNTVQLMAIQEHPYYASFGYQVTNFFAPSYRYGSPEDLKYLINKAHRMNIAVILDVVHSHACPNVGEGLNRQDGTDGQYFYEGGRGWHSAWGTRCFDYGRGEVLHFLLSNLKYWMEEFHFDGFRFDGVTSMLYENHALGQAFVNYSQYYTENTNIDACVYLMLANELIHAVRASAITVAEDMSGMPGMCLPVSSSGFGFGYRLSMGVPDMWIKLIKESRMEDWNVFYMWSELTGGRPSESSIGYSESHDQALVGDKTIMFRLADAEMYTGMCKSYHTLTMDTAIDMHKLIRFLTMSLARGGYLNFMGNEFGHPEWIDFPREGNGWSYHYARRQWSLVYNPEFKYEWLSEFDRGMLSLAKSARLHSAKRAESLWLDDAKKLIIFERAGLIFAFNMHPTWSQERAFINTRLTGDGKYRCVFSSDEVEFGGQARIPGDVIYEAKDVGSERGFEIYLPARTAVVLARID